MILKEQQAFLNGMSKFSDVFVAKNYAINTAIDLSSKWGYSPVCKASSKNS